MLLKQLKDGRWIGASVFEIISLPSIPYDITDKDTVIVKHTAAFTQLINEFHRLTGGSDLTMMEFLWATEAAPSQPFQSKIRLFVAVRHIGASPDSTQMMLGNFTSVLTGFMESRQYEVKTIDTLSEVCDLFPSQKTVFAVVKQEKCTGNLQSPFPYYHWDVIPGDTVDNFKALAALFSQQIQCTISFQIFPTRLTQQETSVLQQMAANLGTLATGAYVSGQMLQDPAAKEPYKVYSYYTERCQSPLFTFNILVSGSPETCSLFSAKVISLLQSSQTKAVKGDFGCLDLSGERLDMKRAFLFYPWNINNLLIRSYRNQKLINSYPYFATLMRLPYIVSAEEAAVFMRLPLFEKGMAAFKSNAASGPLEQFDDAVTRSDNIRFGTIPAGTTKDLVIGCPANTFTKHALVVGVPGSGKTTFAFHILLQFFRQGIPFLAIEPTKAEYRGMIDAIPDLQIFTPGNSAVAPFILNPFIPPKGIKVEQYIPSLSSAFKAAFSMPSPLDVIFLKAIRECYAKYGWKDYSQQGDPDVTVFGLFEFILTFKKLIQESNYSPEVKGNLESGGVFRLLNLIEQNRSVYDTVHTISIEDLLSKPSVIELNAIENAEQKALIMALLLINICSYTKSNHIGDGKLKNIILIDEAHVLLGNVGQASGDGAPDARGTTVKAIQDMIAEIRSYGTGIIIADQSPAKVSREVVAQTEIKVAFRLVQSRDKELIADTTNMEDVTSQQLSKLKVGEAYIYYSKLDSALLVQTPDIREEAGIRLSVSNDEIAQKMTYWQIRRHLLRPYQECALCDTCQSGCDFKVRADADFYAKQFVSVCSSKIRSQEDLLRYGAGVQKLLKRQAANYPDTDFPRLVRCTTIKFCRNIQLDTPFKLSSAQMKALLQRSFEEGKEI